MKTILAFTFFMLLSISCQTNPCTMTASEFSNVGTFKGTVHMHEGNCPMYIEITGSMSKSTLMEYKTIYPVNLAKKFQKKGLHLQFNYTVSRAMSPEGCQVDAVASVSDVQVIRSEKN